MTAKKKSTKSGQTAAQGKGKAKGYGQKFKGDFGDAAPIRARGGHPKILALKTYGGLREFLAKALGQGKKFEAVGKELQVSGSRISEFVNILGVERPRKGKPEIRVDRPATGPDGEYKIKAPREKKGKRGTESVQ